MRRGRGPVGTLIAVTAALVCGLTGTALAAFPFEPQGAARDYGSYRLPASRPVPDDLRGKLSWMYASTAETSTPYAADARELNGVRGAHVVDANRAAGQAWHTTTGRPDVTIAVLDSGIKWNDDGVMADVRKKTRLNSGELPAPRRTRSKATEPGVDCSAFTHTGADDLNGDGVFNIIDFACDSRVDPSPALGVNPGLLDPQDILIAFSRGGGPGGKGNGAGGTDSDHNGYVDDIVGWDFLDDDNDPFDDVQYGHGSGEARDSSGEANNGGDLGACPNCMEIHLRVGTSFVADVNRFALATFYAVDNNVLVVQEALGTLNKSNVGRRAVDYAWEHGTTVIASAADEAAQHHNWPSSYPHVIQVNSVTHDDTISPVPESYVQFNGCTNFNAKVDLAIPSVSCSSDATGRGAGIAGLVYSAALDAREQGKLQDHPTCRRADRAGTPCVVSADEVRQILAAGSVKVGPGPTVAQADDVNFATAPLTGISTELPCPAPGCTDPFLGALSTRIATPPQSYPARRGRDQFYGYGRVNADRAVDALVPEADSPTAGPSLLPPEAEITSPEWFAKVDPAQATLSIQGRAYARGDSFTCRLLVAPGSYPGLGDFKTAGVVSGGACDGTTAHTGAVSGELAQVDVAKLKALFPPGSAGDFRGREPGPAPLKQTHSGRPNTEPYGFTVKLVATRTVERPLPALNVTLTSEDQRNLHLHRDSDMLPGFPKRLAGDGEASPLLADLDGDNRNELIVANSDGVVHAWRPDGSELRGFPVMGDALPTHRGSRATTTGALGSGTPGAFLASPAVGDLNHDGVPEIVAADLEGRVYVWSAAGRRIHRLSASRAYAGVPTAPFKNTRGGHLDRTQLGFLGSPVLADIDHDDGGRLEIVAAALDRHVYAWNDNGTRVKGYPEIVVDKAKVQSIAPTTHKVRFKTGVPTGDDQGAIVATPAVGNLAGDGRPEIVVGTNENYKVSTGGEGPLNAGSNTPTYQALGEALAPANGRLFALRPEGDADGNLLAGASPYLPGWPFRVGILQQGVLPFVGEGISGSPIIGRVPCGGARTAAVGTIPAAGLPYLIKPDGTSCLGRDGGRDRALSTDAGSAPDIHDRIFLPAFGHPAFAQLATGPVFVAPAAGVIRALDVVLPEYQGGQDMLVAWDTQTGSIHPGWPRPVNDLQFLTGPSAGDLDGAGGDEVVAGTASDDLQAFTAAGTDVPNWPKLTGDWTVTNPLLGSFGTIDTDPGAKRVVVSLTRAGEIFAYATGASVCAPASWPRFHHDNANSGDLGRDATLPGRPTVAALSAAGRLTFKSPGDDGLCGKADHYELRTSPAPITPGAFAGATIIEGTFATVKAGATATLSLPTDGLARYVAVRAVDEQGNVGRAAVVDRGPSAGSGGGVRPRCATPRQTITARGIGRFGLGRTVRQLIATNGRPRAIRRGAARWCVRGGGFVSVALDKRSHTRAIVTTASGHHAGSLHKGLRQRAALQELRGEIHLYRRVYRVGRRSPFAFGLRRGRVGFVAVASLSVARNTRTLRRYLGQVGI